MTATVVGCGGSDPQPTGVSTSTPPARQWDAIAFVRVSRPDLPQVTWTLVVTDTLGLNERALTDTLWDLSYGADFAPDGTKLVFAGRVSSRFQDPALRAARPSGLWVVNRDGTGLAPLYVGHAVFPRWSPDGRQIVFTGDTGLWIMNADGSNVHALPNTQESDVQPAMSPDGKLVAFNRIANRSATAAALYVMGIDGTNPRQLAPAASLYVAPSWSSDGRQIAFNQEYRVMVVSVDGGTPAPLVSSAPTGAADFNWRPDGAAVLVSQFAQCCLRYTSVFKGRPADGTWVPVTEPTETLAEFPSWGLKR